MVRLISVNGSTFALNNPYLTEGTKKIVNFIIQEHDFGFNWDGSRVSTQGAPPVTPPGAGPPRGAPSARGWVFESKFSIVQKIILNLKFKNSHYFHIFNGSDQD